MKTNIALQNYVTKIDLVQYSFLFEIIYNKLKNVVMT